METVDELNSGTDENPAQNQSPDDSPEKHPMLLLLGNREVIEDHQKDEEIVDAERQFENIAGEKLKAGLLSLPKVEDTGEDQREHDVHRAPAQSLAKANEMARTVE